MARAQQNLPRAFREPAKTRVAARTAEIQRRRLVVRWATAALLAAIALAALLALLLGHTDGHATAERADREAGALLAGIPQRGQTLGSSTAPITIEAFLDLKDPDSRTWFFKYQPAIIRDYVRPGTVKLEYHAYKTNTFSPQEFVKDQTAALAAGAQGKLWSFIYAFYVNQGSEFTPYATEAFLDNVARQVPGLNLALWHADRHTGRREEQTTAEDQTARALGLHVTPSFRLGRTGGPMSDFSGHAITKYGEQHPIAFIEAKDVGRAIEKLTSASRGSTARRAAG